MKNGTTFKHWAKKDVDFLINNYSYNGSVYCAEKLNRSPSSIRQGLSFKTKHRSS